MEEKWKELYATGKVDSPFEKEKFDFLAKLFGGMMKEKKQS